MGCREGVPRGGATGGGAGAGEAKGVGGGGGEGGSGEAGAFEFPEGGVEVGGGADAEGRRGGDEAGDEALGEHGIPVVVEAGAVLGGGGIGLAESGGGPDARGDDGPEGIAAGAIGGIGAFPGGDNAVGKGNGGDPGTVPPGGTESRGDGGRVQDGPGRVVEADPFDVAGDVREGGGHAGGVSGLGGDDFADLGEAVELDGGQNALGAPAGDAQDDAVYFGTLHEGRDGVGEEGAVVEVEEGDVGSLGEFFCLAGGHYQRPCQVSHCALLAARMSGQAACHGIRNHRSFAVKGGSCQAVVLRRAGGRVRFPGWRNRKRRIAEEKQQARRIE